MLKSASIGSTSPPSCAKRTRGIADDDDNNYKVAAGKRQCTEQERRCTMEEIHARLAKIDNLRLSAAQQARLAVAIEQLVNKTTQHHGDGDGDDLNDRLKQLLRALLRHRLHVAEQAQNRRQVLQHTLGDNFRQFELVTQQVQQLKLGQVSLALSRAIATCLPTATADSACPNTNVTTTTYLEATTGMDSCSTTTNFAQGSSVFNSSSSLLPPTLLPASKLPPPVRHLFYDTRLVQAWEQAPLSTLPTLDWDDLLQEARSHVAAYRQWMTAATSNNNNNTHSPSSRQRTPKAA